MATGGNARIRLQLQGARQVVAGLGQTTQAVGHLARQTSAYNAGVSQAHHRTFLMNQALFTMRRFAYAATLGFGALAAASTRMGLNFNISMEQNTIAMEHFLGSETAATNELEYLYELAARTPFEFQQVVNAERRFLAFGFSVDEARKALGIIGDVAAGLGGDPAENIERLVLVLGQVRATGRVLGQDMLQLQQLGINTNQIFREELGLTREQLKQGVGELQIPSEVAIPALLEGMNKQFEGMAAEQAKTLGGMLSTLHDYTAQLMGELTTPLFMRLRDSIVPGLIEMNKELSIAADKGASWADMMGIIDSHIGAHGALARTWRILANVGGALANIFQNAIVPGLAFVAAILGVTLLPVLEEFTWFLLQASEHSGVLKYAVIALTTVFIVSKFWTMTLFFWNMRLAIAWGISAAANRKYAGTIASSVFWMVRAVRATKAWALATVVARSSIGTFMRVYAHNGLFARAVRMVMTMVTAMRAWAVWNLIVGRTFMMIPIIGWIAAIITAIIYLEMKFHFIQRTIEGIWDLFKRFKEWITGNKISWSDFLPSTDAPGWLHALAGGIPGARAAIGAYNALTGMAGGGLVTGGGAFLVGERGPEIAMLPRGSAVTPLGNAGVPLGGGFDLELTLRNIFEVDGEKLEEKLSTVRLNKQARR